ncbi:hypothetical protein KC19_9G064000 [Ceratodon purpureus]|uniref:Uncharacterized protein n=1 Tax=Ceratodon purpureus TaxID=3225 RepID=A0A8T0GPA9_CERPU|nr:hypothetical protein KC19_9G064000 [Ceratodon purpureus]
MPGILWSWWTRSRFAMRSSAIVVVPPLRCESRCNTRDRSGKSTVSSLKNVITKN